MRTTRELVADSGIPEHEAVRLLAMATDRPMTSVRIGFAVSDDTLAHFEDLVSRRRSGEPLQYIEGSVAFGPVSIAVDERVLIPRPETEEILEIVRGRCPDPEVVVDLCTGSGALAVALAATFPGASVYATDVDPGALAVARVNAEANRVAVSFFQGDLFAALPRELAGEIDVLVANPPYLTVTEYGEAPADVKREPIHALVSGRRGSEYVERIAHGAPAWLSDRGIVVCEISEFRSESASAAFGPLGGETVLDGAGKPRFVLGARTGGLA